MPVTPLQAGDTPTAGQFLTALNAYIGRTVYQAADQISPDTNNVFSPYLILPVDANSVYALDAAIFYDTNATADFFTAVAVPSGASTTPTSWWAQALADSATNSPIDHSQATYGLAGGVASGTLMSMRPTGLIVVGATAGNAQVYFSQNTTTAINTILKKGSWMRLTKVA